MSNEKKPSKPGQRSSRTRKILHAGGILAAIVIGLYFTATSSFFLKAFVLPKVGDALNARVTASNVALSPFSRLTLEDFRVFTSESDPVLSVAEARIRYDLLAILRGDVQVQEITLAEPSVHVVMSADGTSNLDPFLTRSTSGTPKPAGSAQPLTVRNISIKNGRVRFTRNPQEDAVQNLTLSGLDLTVDKITAGQTASLAFSGKINWNNLAPRAAPANGDALDGRATTTLEILFDEHLFPTSIRGGAQLELATATGQYAALAGLKGLVTTDVTSTEIRALNIQLEKGGADLGKFHASGPWNLEDSTGRLIITIDPLNLAPWRTVVATNLPSGTVTLNATLQTEENGGKLLATVDGQLDNLDFAFGTNKFDNAQIQIRGTGILEQYSVDANPERIEIHTLKASIEGETGPAANVELTGSYGLSDNVAQVKFRASGLNEGILGPILEPMLAPSKLISGSFTGDGTATYDPNGESVFKGAFELQDLVLRQPGSAVSHPALTSRVELDGSLENQILDLRQLLLRLPPTSRASNEVRVVGRIDFNGETTNGNRVSIEADALDLTQIYDLFDGSGSDSQAREEPQNSENVPPPGEALTAGLPVKQLDGELRIGQLYLREVAVTDLQLLARLTDNQVTLAPVQLALNGAPVSASAFFDLETPEIRYDLSLDTDLIPLEPIANSFSTNSPGQFKGELVARAQIKGSGFTGASLQESLTGQAFVSLTNLNLQFVGPKTKRVLEPIALVLRIPELTQTPLNWASAEANLGDGQITINRFAALSHALYAQGQGNIRIDKVLTNSPIRIPIHIALRRSLAEKSRLVPAGTPTKAAYVPLPDFAKVSGTIGEPKTDINKLVVSGLLLRSAGNIPQVGDKAGNLLQGIGSLLSGQNVSGAGANNPVKLEEDSGSGTNKPPALNPLDLLKLFPRKDP